MFYVIYRGHFSNPSDAKNYRQCLDIVGIVAAPSFDAAIEKAKNSFTWNYSRPLHAVAIESLDAEDRKAIENFAIFSLSK